jgi:hypothetical protein
VRPQPLAYYLRHVRIPTVEEAAQSGAERLIFPAVAHVTGAAASAWRSDLLVHNPNDQPLALTLRYLTARNIERVIDVSPQSTRVFADVVNTVFAAPGTSGSLVVLHGKQRVPFVRVATYDSARQQTAKFEPPLGPEDAAEAGRERSRLLLVGVPGGQGRRVHLGIVNVGDAPASFRVAAIGADGAPVGTPIETHLEELSAWVLPNAGEALGVTIDPALAIHIELITGKAVAYASSVETMTGQSQMIHAVPR